MIATDFSNCLKHYPLPMSRFGLNPFGENRFRLVLAQSRMFIVQGQWRGAGLPKAQWCKLYPQIPMGLYVLEEWHDAFSVTGTTEDLWNRGDGQYLGPYPSRGDYLQLGDIGFNPAEFNIEKLITLVHASDKYSWNEKLVACKNAATKAEIENRCERDAIIRDCFPAFGHAPFSQLSTGGGGAGKSSPVHRSANEMGTPMPIAKPGKATTRGATVKQRKMKYEIPVHA